MDTEITRQGGVFIDVNRRLDQMTRPFEGLAWLALRATTGLLLMPHGAQKLFGAFGGGGISGTAGFLESAGYPAPTIMAILIGCVEFIGGLMLTIGFMTRFAAAAVAVFMAFAVLFHLGNGFFWMAKGYEYPLLWGIVALFFLVRGGGAFSVDGSPTVLPGDK
ncbi:MAG: DoxX family protein [Pseudorhodobacter sp.]